MSLSFRGRGGFTHSAPQLVKELMAKYRRFHPISHDFNRDPEIIALRRDFGDWAALAWQECLSIADRNDGIVPGSLDQIASILAPVSLQMYHRRAQNAARTMLERFTDNSWITVRPDCIEIVKYWEYHRRRDAKQAPSEPNLTKPNLIKIREDKIKSARKCALPTEFQPSKAIMSWASEKNLPDPATEFDAFRDYHASRGSQFIDWDAAFRTWLRNAKKFNRNGDRPGRQREGELSERTQRMLRRGL